MSMITTETGKPKFSWEVAGPVRVTGEFNPARRIGEEISSRGERDLYIDGYVYWTVPPGEKGVQGKPWVMARSEPIGRPNFAPRPLPGIPISGTSLSNAAIPQNLLTLLKSVGTVRDEGPTSGPGWTGTRYSFSMPTAVGPYRIVRGTVDVDQQGRVRRLVATSVFREDFSSVTGIDSVTNDITFSDFGLRVSVTAPPASQVYKEPGGGYVVILGSF
jgi:hypothetical protein